MQISAKLPVLLIGYNRSDLFARRLSELRDSGVEDLFISIDGPKNEFDIKAQNRILELINEERKFIENLNISYQERNLGLARHITKAINNCFKSVKHLLIIEDDISIDRNGFNSYKEATPLLLGRKAAFICGFSSLSSNTFPKLTRRRNEWRESSYFNPWGWATTSEVWGHYQQEIDLNSFRSLLEKSKSWRVKGDQEKEIWLRRFQRVAENPNFTWDFQVQYMIFVNELTTLLPKYSIHRNQGFGDARASNTKSSRPWWMKSDSTFSEPVHTANRKNSLENWLLNLLDRLTWLGVIKLEMSKFKKIYNNKS